MDRITLTWEDALADPSAAAVLLRKCEEEAEDYIVRSRTVRQWLESVPPLTVMETSASTAGPDAHGLRTPVPETGTDDMSSTVEGPRSQGGARNRCTGEPSSPPSEEEPPSRPHEGRGCAGGGVPPQREAAEHREAGNGPSNAPGAASAPRTGQEPVPPGGQQPTLYERVEVLLQGLPPGAPQTARGIAEMVGHANLRSLRPVLDRMAVRGLLVKTELHPRAVVYHRPEGEGPVKEATMF
ncbi:hypothetical protein [Streptomyces sp. PTD5-9]|uniref:hypothetical protein n=1 Tax=Streptomyces sp. PTD5-9 TaxID=3120150 RepID=UPI00300A4D99